MLPRPEPLPELQDSGLGDAEQRALADVRRFVTPGEQALIERSLRDLARDARLPQAAVTGALQRALSGMRPASGFCARLAEELGPLRRSGPEADAPETLAFVASIDDAHGRWLSSAGRSRYAAPAALARALRDDELAPDAFDPGFVPGDAGVLFLTDAAALLGSGESVAGRVCLSGPPAASFVVAEVPRQALRGALRVPTAADGVCREDFVLSPADARLGRTCSGAPEFVASPVPLGAVSRFRLAR
jgi:hypothetical protein